MRKICATLLVLMALGFSGCKSLSPPVVVRKHYTINMAPGSFLWLWGAMNNESHLQADGTVEQKVDSNAQLQGIPGL